jgi:hypothetical protein
MRATTWMCISDGSGWRRNVQTKCFARDVCRSVRRRSLATVVASSMVVVAFAAAVATAGRRQRRNVYMEGREASLNRCASEM